jgi:hypothetical protein
MSVSNTLATGVSDAVGSERAELIMNSAGNWMLSIGIREPMTLVVKHYPAGNEQRLRFELFNSFAPTNVAQLMMRADVSPRSPFPESFRPVFPNGWADVAKREGFELPEAFQKK